MSRNLVPKSCTLRKAVKSLKLSNLNNDCRRNHLKPSSSHETHIKALRPPTRVDTIVITSRPSNLSLYLIEWILHSRKKRTSFIFFKWSQNCSKTLLHCVSVTIQNDTFIISRLLTIFRLKTRNSNRLNKIRSNFYLKPMIITWIIFLTSLKAGWRKKVA